MSLVQTEAVRVFTEPVSTGDHVTFLATASVGTSRHRRCRPVALIEADTRGVRVKPILRVTPVVLAAAAAIAAAILARSR